MARTRSVSIIRAPAPRAAAPIVVVGQPRRSGGRRRSSGGHRRTHRRRGGIAGGQSTKDVMMKVAVGGAAFALIEKQMPNFPTLPVLGRAGSVAAAAYFFGGKKKGILRDLAIAASVVAAYQFIHDGKIAGDDAMGDHDAEGDD